MNQPPNQDPNAFGPPSIGGSSADLHGASPQVDAIVADAMGQTAPTASKARHKHLLRPRKPRPAAGPQVTHQVVARSKNSSPALWMLAWGLVAILALGVAAVMFGAVQLGPEGVGPNDRAGDADRDGSWSFYHDRDYETRGTGAKFATDRSRSSDPDEAVLGDTTRWEYDGPYRYGPYGSDGMRRRQSGRESADPLYSQPAPIQDVFSTYGGDLDPSGGQPVGVAPSSMTSPYYDPYAGYSNPYANRIRLGYGEGIGRGAQLDLAP